MTSITCTYNDHELKLRILCLFEKLLYAFWFDYCISPENRKTIFSCIEIWNIFNSHLYAKRKLIYNSFVFPEFPLEFHVRWSHNFINIQNTLWNKLYLIIFSYGGRVGLRFLDWIYRWNLNDKKVAYSKSKIDQNFFWLLQPKK